MRILMFTPLFHPHIGGLEKHVKQVGKELIKKGHKVTVVTLKYNVNLLDFEEFEKIKVYRLPKMNLLRVWSWLYKKRGLIKRIDVVHCHDFITFFWYLPFRFSYFSKPVFITFHGFEGIVPIPRRIIFLRKLAEILAKGNICIGEYISKWYGTKPDFVVYGGVDEPPTQDGAAENENTIFLGRLERDTGIMIYLQAVKTLKENYNINLKINICGDGSLRREIKKFGKENAINIKLHGFVSNPFDYLMSSKFAFVSGYLTILEAMISKKLVFSVYRNELKKDYLTTIPNSEDIMVMAGSPRELTEAIIHYHQNPQEREKKVEKAYQFAKKQTWNKVADTYFKLWNK